MAWWDDIGAEPCMLKDVCTHNGKSGCKPTCAAYYYSRQLYDLSNLPKKAYDIPKLIPEKIDTEAYKICNAYKEDIVKHVNNGNGIYLYSENKGNGKTTWAFKFAKEYITQMSLSKDRDKASIYYVNISELFNTLRNSFSGDTETNLPAIEKRILESELVIFDDLGVEAPTDWVLEKLYNYINKRYTDGKAMIFTSNLNLADVAKRAGVRIMDRVSEVCRPVEFKGVSRRRMKVWWDD